MLVKVACAALPEALLESELFGFERGAFSGASKAKPGRLEVADKGTLFLDDVDTLPIGIQAKLLRALQEGEVQRLGSNQLRHVDIRIVAATNRDLTIEIREGRFREDLYYWLNVVPLRLPPLRERREDIAPLVEHFIREEAPRLGREIRGIAAEALAELEKHSWPGNIRELRNVVQRAIVLSSEDVLRLSGPLAESGVASGSAKGDDARGASLAEDMRLFKRRSVQAALAKAGGDREAAAEALGLPRQVLARSIRELDLQAEASAPRGGKRAAEDRRVDVDVRLAEGPFLGPRADPQSDDDRGSPLEQQEPGEQTIGSDPVRKLPLVEELRGAAGGIVRCGYRHEASPDVWRAQPKTLEVSVPLSSSCRSA